MVNDCYDILAWIIIMTFIYLIINVPIWVINLFTRVGPPQWSMY